MFSVMIFLCWFFGVDQTTVTKSREERLSIGEQISRNAISNRLEEFGISSLDELKLLHRDEDLGAIHISFGQVYRGLNVDARLVVHIANRDGGVTFTDSLIHNLNLSIVPAITLSRAREIALGACPRCTVSGQPELMISRKEPVQRAAPVLVYRVEFAGIDTLPVYLIDASNGSVLWKYDRMKR